ncbi:hypothetical protein Y032_0009g540 [Ancylostoma ceylanicum]|nr:hypothetical protein Y032_0009g540 [Ancylostoma ceylanicum]
MESFFVSFPELFYFDFTGWIQNFDLLPNNPIRYPPDHFAAAAIPAARAQKRMAKRNMQKCVSKRSNVYGLATHGNHGLVKVS